MTNNRSTADDLEEGMELQLELLISQTDTMMMRKMMTISVFRGPRGSQQP